MCACERIARALGGLRSWSAFLGSLIPAGAFACVVGHSVGSFFLAAPVLLLYGGAVKLSTGMVLDTYIRWCILCVVAPGYLTSRTT